MDFLCHQEMHTKTKEIQFIPINYKNGAKSNNIKCW